MNNPCLSIILSVRNDNYGGDFTNRLQNMLDWNIEWLEKYKIHSEIILVNWNPLAHNLSLQQQINLPENRQFVSVRIITVPEEIHQTLTQPDKRKPVELYEFIAKNVGIRRAQGDWILSTNADVLMHPDIFKYIAKGKLKANRYYRANRADFEAGQIHHNEEWLFGKTSIVSYKGFYRGLLSQKHKKFEYFLKYFFNEWQVRKELFKLKVALAMKKMNLTPFFDVVTDNAEYHAHCNNCGDFMLMHKDWWYKLKGYPEETSISTHTDALFTIFAFHHLEEKVFCKPVFHQIHNRRYTWEDIRQKPEFQLAYQNFQQKAQQILQRKFLPKEFLNKDDWGLSIFELEEIVF